MPGDIAAAGKRPQAYPRFGRPHASRCGDLTLSVSLTYSRGGGRDSGFSYDGLFLSPLARIDCALALTCPRAGQALTFTRIYAWVRMAKVSKGAPKREGTPFQAVSPLSLETLTSSAERGTPPRFARWLTLSSALTYSRGER